MREAHEATPFDTIYALATSAGVADRAVFRVSGALAFDTVSDLAGAEVPRCRGVCEVDLKLPGQYHEVVLPCRLLTFVAPASYTGEDVIELHTISSAPVHDLVLEQLQVHGLREAWPGEFTRRAFQNGKLELEQAEAVIAVIRAKDADSLRRAEGMLHTSGARATHSLRDRVLALLALLESGLDFEAGETGEVEPGEWLPELESLATELAYAVEREARPSLDRAVPSYLMLGPPNAGKTSLWNALCTTDAAGIVSDVAGTTRDVRWGTVAAGRCRLGDAPGRDLGWSPSATGQEMRILRQELALVDGYLWVAPCTATAPPPIELEPPLLVVQTKSDLLSEEARPRTDRAALACSSVTGEGLDVLKRAMDGLGRRGAWAEEWGARVQSRLGAAAEALQRAVDGACRGLGTECVAAELRDACAALEPIDAKSVPEELLDRIFASFCLGK